MGKQKVFLDSSVIISALLSNRGGSFYILNALSYSFDLQINEYVLEEILGILNQKFKKDMNMRPSFFAFLGAGSISVLPNPTMREVKNLQDVISENDTPILASALKNSDFLVTLDKEFLDQKILDLASNQGLSILNPKEFIELFKK